MNIILNGKSTTIADTMTIRQLVESLKLQPRFVAVECNRELVPRGRHAEYQLKAGDEVEVVTLVGGG